MPDRLRVAGEGANVGVSLVDNAATFDDSVMPWHVRPVGDGAYEARNGSLVFAATAAESGDEVWVCIEGEVFAFRVGATHRESRTANQEALMAPMPATVVRVVVAPGQAVAQGDLLLALEAMKMELPIRAPRDGVIDQIHCREGDLVQPGTVLVSL